VQVLAREREGRVQVAEYDVRLAGEDVQQARDQLAASQQQLQVGLRAACAGGGGAGGAGRALAPGLAAARTRGWPRWHRHEAQGLRALAAALAPGLAAGR
jgi:hypothetical protein